MNWHRDALWDSGCVGFEAQILLCIDLHGGILFTVMYNQCSRKRCVTMHYMITFQLQRLENDMFLSMQVIFNHFQLLI